MKRGSPGFDQMQLSLRREREGAEPGVIRDDVDVAVGADGRAGDHALAVGRIREGPGTVPAELIAVIVLPPAT